VNSFQRNLKEMMIEKNINRSQLSKIVNIPSSTIDSYFYKDIYPSLKVAEKFSQFFDCSLEYLFGLTENQENYKQYSSRSFYETYETLLKENNLKSSEVLKSLNMGRNNARRWKKGLIPKTINLIELAKFLKVSIDYLVGKND